MNLELLDGLLIADSTLQRRVGAKSVGYRYAHHCISKDYINWIVANLGIAFGKIHEKPNGYGTGITYQIYSLTVPDLAPVYDRWYKEGKKVVPADLKLTPTVCLHWYIGDGGLDSDSGYLRQICIAVHGFIPEDRQRLADQLVELGFKASMRTSGKLCIAKSSIPDFLDYIGQSPVEDYKYKWDIESYQSKQPKYKLS